MLTVLALIILVDLQLVEVVIFTRPIILLEHLSQVVSLLNG
nr:MAG TPA: hypothetical protein [Caudoviricetes sp.]